VTFFKQEPAVLVVLLVASVCAIAAGVAPVDGGADKKAVDDMTALLKARVALAQKGYEAAFAGLVQTTRQGNFLGVLNCPFDRRARTEYRRRPRAASPRCSAGVVSARSRWALSP
jgi:hypothetical protein